MFVLWRKKLHKIDNIHITRPVVCFFPLETLKQGWNITDRSDCDIISIYLRCENLRLFSGVEFTLILKGGFEQVYCGRWLHVCLY